MDKQLTNPFIQKYLEYTKDTESPAIFHTWAGLSAVSACLGQHVYTDFGLGPIYGNMYVVLVGPPGVRKSTAIHWVKDRLKKAVNLNYAPTDTAGQRQGLMAAFCETAENYTDQKRKQHEIDKAFSSVFSEIPDNIFFDIEEQSNNTDPLDFAIPNEKIVELAETATDSRAVVDDKETLFGMYSEFDSLIGQKQREMLTFLINMWDGEKYEYKLASKEHKLHNPRFSFLAATTPSSIAESLPVGSGASGFLSRLILVFSEETTKKIADPQPPDPKICNDIELLLHQIAREVKGCIGRTPEAKVLLEEIYLRGKIQIQDPRFIFYVQRRYSHLIKLCLILAVARQSSMICPIDVHEALAILKYTEVTMHKALGQFGNTPVGQAQQELLDYVAQHGYSIKKPALLTHLLERFKFPDVEQAINNLMTLNKIQIQSAGSKGDLVISNIPRELELEQKRARNTIIELAQRQA